MEAEELYKHMNNWQAFVRRYKANLFDVFFYDIDDSLKEEDIQQIVSNVAEFYHLELPLIYTKCSTLAQMNLTNAEDDHSELYYNWKLLKGNGINNKDALTMCIVHEMAHLYFRGRRFRLCKNERWCHELAADYVVGLYAALYFQATGKYKYVIQQQGCSFTHPDGKLRSAIVDYAFDMVFKLQTRDLETLMFALPAFVYQHANQLNQDFLSCVKKEMNPSRHFESPNFEREFIKKKTST